jgi:hypothetical protein
MGAPRLAVSTLLIFSIGPVFPLQAEEKYNKVCNRTDLTVIFVNAFRQENTNKWTTQSGVNLGPGACANVYRASASPWTAYYVAFGIGKKGVSKSAVWSGVNRAEKGPLLCVFPFELSAWKISNQVDGNESSCKGEELSMEPFVKQPMTQNTTIQLTLEKASRRF